jgi:ribonuclease HII
MKQKWVVGIDEAGRGPLAGPVSVGVVIVPVDFDWSLLKGVNDSKKLTAKKREEIFRLTKKLKATKQLNYQVEMVTAKTIDKIGIVPSIKKALIKALAQVTRDIESEEIKVLLDGCLKAPEKYLHQETIVKGDSKEKVIGLASIMAKVTRDNYMEKVGTQVEFLPYSLEVHKGYGTKKHREAIAACGLSRLHRITFCRNIDIK